MAAALRDKFSEQHQPEECASGVHPVAPARRREPSPFAIPHVPGLELVPRRLDEKDEADLRWRLSEPHVAGLFGSSGMGASLERAESYGYGARPCRRCGGQWRRKLRRRSGKLGPLTKGIENEVEFAVWRDGTGRMPRKIRLGPRAGQRPSYARALADYRKAEAGKWRIVVISQHAREEHVRDATINAFWARGEMVVTPQELAEMYPTLPDELTEPCTGEDGTCGGIGVVPRRDARQSEVTVWPKGSSVRLGGREGLDANGLADAVANSDARKGWVRDAAASVSLNALERYVLVEGLLRAAAGVAPLARVALEEYYRPYSEPSAPAVVRAADNGDHAALAEIRLKSRECWERLSDLTPAANEPEHLRGPESLWRARVASQAAELYSFACGVYNLVAYGTGET